MMQETALVSVCIVTRNQSAAIARLLHDLSATLQNSFSHYEILIIDNGSADGTIETLRAALPALSSVRVLRLSRPCAYDTAITAALDHAIGDYVITFDFITDLALIPRLVAKAQEGYDIVVVRRNLQALYSPIDRAAAKWLYGLAALMLDYPIDIADGHTRLFSRRVVNALGRIRSRRRYMRHFGTIVGYRHTFIADTSTPQRQRVNRREKIAFLLNLILNGSIRPLRLAALLGVGASFLSLLYILYILAVTLIREGQLVEGWLTTSLFITTLFFLLFAILSILVEYIGRLLEETRDEPLYFIEAEHDSLTFSHAQFITENVLNVEDDVEDDVEDHLEDHLEDQPA